MDPRATNTVEAQVHILVILVHKLFRFFLKNKILWQYHQNFGHYTLHMDWIRCIGWVKHIRVKSTNWSDCRVWCRWQFSTKCWECRANFFFCFPFLISLKRPKVPHSAAGSRRPESFYFTLCKAMWHSKTAQKSIAG